MTPKYLALIGGGVTVVGGGATGAYFLMQEKEQSPTNKKVDSQKTKNPVSLKESLKDVTFLKTNDDTHKTEWGKLVDKFLEEDPKVTKIVASEITKTEPATNKDANIIALKKACENLLNKTDFREEEKTIAKIWCTINSTLLTVTPLGQA